MTTLPALYPKQTAIQIRKLLRAAFPATKFSVVTERGSMVSSVRISWTDGPTPALVEDIAYIFKAGNFDGMTDSYTYNRSSFLEIDGTLYRPGCQYIFCSREISAELANRCIQQVSEFWGGVEVVPVAHPSKWGYSLVPNIGREPVCRASACDDDWHSAIHQAAWDRTHFTREG